MNGLQIFILLYHFRGWGIDLSCLPQIVKCGVSPQELLREHTDNYKIKFNLEPGLLIVCER